jgi:hypothetical protein
MYAILFEAVTLGRYILVLMLPLLRIFLKYCFYSCLLSQCMSHTIKSHIIFLSYFKRQCIQYTLSVQHIDCTIYINQIDLRNYNADTLLLKPCPKPPCEPRCKTISSLHPTLQKDMSSWKQLTVINFKKLHWTFFNTVCWYTIFGQTRQLDCKLHDSRDFVWFSAISPAPRTMFGIL